jgi:hypothetical protein
MNIYRTILTVAALGLAAATVRQAGAAFVVDDFETYASGARVNAIGNGWGAGDNSVVVTNLLAASGTNSVCVPPWMTVSNAVIQPGATYPHVWTEYKLYDNARVVPGEEPGPSGNEGIMLGVSTGGYAIVYDPGVTNWVTYTNDVWGTNMYLATNAWAAFSVFENFTNGTAAVFLNGHLLRTGLRFINNSLANYGAFRLEGGNLTNAFLDNVIISNAIPASLTNIDLDNDGVVDAVEVDLYGSVTAWGAVVSNTVNMGISSVTLPGNLLVTNGATLTFSGSNLVVSGTVSVAGDSGMVVTNARLQVSDLVLQSGATLRVTNGAVTVNGVIMTGTFTLDSNWRTTLRPSVLNFTDGFETYPNGTPLRMLAFCGWAATDAGAVVTNVPAVVTLGVNAAYIPAGVSVSNTVSAAGITNVWTELYLNQTVQETPESQPLVKSNSAVMLFFATNGFLTIYNPASNGWDVCSNDVQNTRVNPVLTGQWARISIFQNFSNHTAAIFLNDRLMREQVGFISTTLSSYGSVTVNQGQDGTTYLDGVKIWTNVPGLVGDLNFDRIVDAREIELYGSMRIYPAGSVYVIR